VRQLLAPPLEQLLRTAVEDAQTSAETATAAAVVGEWGGGGKEAWAKAAEARGRKVRKGFEAGGSDVVGGAVVVLLLLVVMVLLESLGPLQQQQLQAGGGLWGQQQGVEVAVAVISL